jgi:hypothetical protein
MKVIVWAAPSGYIALNPCMVGANMIIQEYQKTFSRILKLKFIVLSMMFLSARPRNSTGGSGRDAPNVVLAKDGRNANKI